MHMMDMLKKVTAASGFTHAAGVQVVAAQAGLVTMDLPKKPELLQFNGFFSRRGFGRSGRPLRRGCRHHHTGPRQDCHRHGHFAGGRHAHPRTRRLKKQEKTPGATVFGRGVGGAREC